MRGFVDMSPPMCARRESGGIRQMPDVLRAETCKTCMGVREGAPPRNVGGAHPGGFAHR